MKYWLFKTEPGSYSFVDLTSEREQTTGWDGVRNFQARNFLRDDVKIGDLVFFYHSNAEPAGIAGIARVVEEAHPDPTAFDPSDKHFDPKSDRASPTWFQVSIRAVVPIDPMLELPRLRAIPELSGMELLRKGSRLSVQPVRKSEWDAIVRLAGIDPNALERATPAARTQTPARSVAANSESKRANSSEQVVKSKK